MIPDDLLQRLVFDGSEAHLLLRILVGVVAFAVLLRRDALGESAARMGAAVAVGVVTFASLPIVDTSARLGHPVGGFGVFALAASLPLWVELVSPALMLGLGTAALMLQLVAALGAVGVVPPGAAWAGIVAVGGALGAVLHGRAPGVTSVLAASGAAAWSLGLGAQPVAIGVAMALGLAVNDLPRLTRRAIGKETSYEVGR